MLVCIAVLGGLVVGWLIHGSVFVEHFSKFRLLIPTLVAFALVVPTTVGIDAQYLVSRLLPDSALAQGALLALAGVVLGRAIEATVRRKDASRPDATMLT